MRLRTLLGAGASAPAEIRHDDREALEALYRPPTQRWLRLNLVLGLDGSAAGAEGTSDGLSSRTDRAVLGAIRRTSDVVLVGAATVRAERYRAPRTAHLAIVTASGDLTGHRLEAADAARVLFLVPEGGPAAARLSSEPGRVIELPASGDAVRAEAIVGALRSQGLSSVVCEGGPSLARELGAAGLIDEVCLTTAPRFGRATPGGPGEPIAAEPAEGFRLGQLLIDEQTFLYGRWFADRPAPSASR